MKKFFLSWKNSIILVLLIILLALGIRLYNLTLLPVFVDEAIYIRWSQVMASEPTLRFLPLSDGKQPLFMWILMFIVKRFSDPLFAGRLVSVFSGIGTILGLFLVTFYLFKSRKVALISCFLWAVSPYSVFFDRMALVDSLLTMFGVWTFFWGVATASSLRLDLALITGFALGATLLTKSPALFFTILLPSVFLVSREPKFKNKKNVIVHLIKFSMLIIVAYIIGYGMYSILRLGPNFHLIAIRNFDYVFPISHLWTNPKDPFIFHIRDIIQWVWQLGPGTIFFMLAVGIFINFKRFTKEVVLLLIWLLLPILIQSMYAKVFTARYILFSLPIVFILSASSFLTKHKTLNNETLKKILISALILFIISSFRTDFYLLTDPARATLPRSEKSGYLEEWTAGEGISQVSELIKKEHLKDPSKQIVVGTEGFFGTLPDGLQIYLESTPNVIVKGIGLGISDIHPSLVEAKKFGNKTYLLVNSSRFLGDAQKLGLKLISVYPKAIRPNGSRETLLFFEVTTEALEIGTQDMKK